MKKLILLLFVAAIANGQSVFQYRPPVGTTKVDSARTVSGSTLVRWLRADSFDTSKVVAGLRILGKGIPFGATVSSVKSTGDSLYLSSAATVTDTVADVSIGYFTGSQAYSAGHAVGWPFAIPFKKIYSVVITDDASQIATGLNLVFFDGIFEPTVEYGAFTPSDADVDKVVGYTSLTTSQALGANKIWTQAATAQPIVLASTGGALFLGTQNKIYCQLVAGGAGTMTAISNLTVKMIGE